MAKIKLHEFTMGDVDDPEIYAAEPIFQWQQTKQGKWCMENADDLHFNIGPDPVGMGFLVTIFGELSGKKLTYFRLTE